MQLKPGLRLRSQVCSTELIVVRPAEVELTREGVPVIAHGEEPGAGLSLDPAMSGGAQLGKRYTDASGTLEILVTKKGDGTLADAARPLPLKEAKPLPSSD